MIAKPRYADVAVCAPFNRGSSTFHYALPADKSIEAGQLVWVPFGKSTVQGVVLDLLAVTDVDPVKEIISVGDPRPVLTAAQVSLARWLARYYAVPVFEAVRLMLPPGSERQTITKLRLADAGVRPPDLTLKQQAVVELLSRLGTLRTEQVSTMLKIKGLSSVIGQLDRRGLIVRERELRPPSVSQKREKLVDLSNAAAEGLRPSATRQQAVLDLLAQRGGPVPQTEVSKETGCSSAVLRALAARGVIRIVERPVRRDPLGHRTFAPTAFPDLTPMQAEAWKEIAFALAQAKSCTFLLHGVTGSGKTELYMRAIAETLKRGEKAIMLVPEIALTPQTIHRFASRFPGAVAVLHSKLSAGEHYDEWHRMRDGDAAVVIGSRSAVFAPLSPLGLIVVDEEHEWSYKQDNVPRYHAREVAVQLAQLTGAKVILGSATPDVSSFHLAESGLYRLLRLSERIASSNEGKPAGSPPPMPRVDVVDMRAELRSGNRTIFSRALDEAITLALAARQQTILFLNRRGTSTFVMCRDCGFVVRCRRCDVSLVFHGDADELVCHQCNYRTFVPETCPDCWSGRIRFFGTGTQKVEEEVRRRFPEARVLRWDRDVTATKHAHENIMRQFAEHEADILIGTQMIAKGLDLPLVTLVGVISADTILHLPDMRACERTFQLLTQVAGRAGRGILEGRAIVQTYSPEHYAVRAASGHDYHAFYGQEIEFRRQQGYPPFARMARVLCSYTSDARAHKEADRIAAELRARVLVDGPAGTTVIGPAPAFRRRIRGKHRWQVLIRGGDPSQPLSSLRFQPGTVVDVDPLSLL